MDVEKAINTLKFSPKHNSVALEKLLLSAVANWGNKNEGVDVADANLYVKTIMVDGARVIKRMQPAPQGRAYRLRKRSNHVTIVVDSRNAVTAAVAGNKENE
jgi:large subunit ribosomal protein L22